MMHIYSTPVSLAVLNMVLWAMLIIGALFVLVLLTVLGSFFNLWIQALVSGCRVQFFELIGMELRKTNPHTIVASYIRARKAGLDLTVSQLETHYLAGGNVPDTVTALITASRPDYEAELDWDTACAIDLTGHDVLTSAQNAARDQTIDVPSPGSGMQDIKAVTQDNVELLLRAKVKARYEITRHLERDEKAADEQTIASRVGTALMHHIGNMADHHEALRDPQAIAEAIKSPSLSEGTAYRINDIEITKVDKRDSWTF